ncbi:MAG: transposase, partial [Candidatus Lokiarchaeota archaeon]|nr:transposase [Candidatus Lokiarchaeota archaeon]
CGRKKKRSIHERVIMCACGNYIDRDLNSAINIMIKFLLCKKEKKYDFLSHQSSVNEESFQDQWKGFLRYTDQSVVEAIVHS